MTLKTKRLIEVCVALKGATQANPFSVPELARAVNLSEKYVDALLRELRKSQIVKTSRGIFGGSFLCVDRLTVGDILKLGQQARSSECPVMAHINDVMTKAIENVVIKGEQHG